MRDEDRRVEDIGEKVDDGRKVGSCASSEKTFRQGDGRIWVKSMWCARVGDEEGVSNCYGRLCDATECGIA